MAGVQTKQISGRVASGDYQLEGLGTKLKAVLCDFFL